MVGGILAVHAHPDDESITMGATLARYAASGVPVTLVTATLGEEGEVMHSGRLGLDGLMAGSADQLGGYRLAELGDACRAMGIADHRILGGLGRFRDSGMAGTASAAHPRAFCRAAAGGPDHEEAVTALLAVIDELRPAVVLSYDADGGYGHPDHVAAHQVTAEAVRRHGRVDRTGGDGDIRFVAVVRPRAAFVAALAAIWERGVPEGYRRAEPDAFGTLVPDDAVDVAVPVGPFGAARRRAMAAHATQLDVWAGAIDGFAVTNRRAQPLLDAEYFRVLAGPAAPAGATDLFDGLPGGLRDGPRDRLRDGPGASR